MSIQVICPGCGKAFKVSDSAAGRKAACPNCSTLMTIGARPGAPTGASAGSEDPGSASWRAGSAFPLFSGHSGAVNFAAITRGGALAITAGEDGTIRLWDIASGNQTASLSGHNGAVNCARIGANGDFIISGGADRTVRLWKVATGKCIRTLEGHADEVTSVAFHPGGAFAVSAGLDKVARSWDLKESKCMRVFEGHDAGVNAVDSNGREHVVTASSDRTLGYWRFAKGKRDGVLKGHGGPVTSVACVGGAFAVSGSADRTGCIWSLADLKHIRVLKGHQGTVRAVAASGIGKLVATGGADWTLRIWDADTGKCLHTIEPESQAVTAVAVDYEGDLVLAGGAGGSLRLWNAHNGALVRDFGGREQAAIVRCPACRKTFQTAAAVVGADGLCPLCGASFHAAAYSPRESEEAARRGADLMRDNDFERAIRAFDEALTYQGDNYRAVLNSAACRRRLAMEHIEARQFEKAVALLDEALRVAAKADPWPVEFTAEARREAYDAAFLAAKVCRFHLGSNARALPFLLKAQTFSSTPEVIDMLSRVEQEPAAGHEKA